jgi:hypothetical protein
MARSPKKSASTRKARGGAKARGRSAAKKTSASKKRASKAAASRKRTSAKTSNSRSRSGGKGRGRTAAKKEAPSKKSVSRRPGSSPKPGPAKSATKRGAKRTRRTENINLSAAVTNPITEAMVVGTEVAAGAVQAGGEIVAATADMAKSAARTVAALTTSVTPETAEASTQGRGRRKRS